VIGEGIRCLPHELAEYRRGLEINDQAGSHGEVVLHIGLEVRSDVIALHAQIRARPDLKVQSTTSHKAEGRIGAQTLALHKSEALPARQDVDPWLNERVALDGNVRPAAEEKRLHTLIWIVIQMPEAKCSRPLRRDGYPHTGPGYRVEEMNAYVCIVAVGVKCLAEHVVVLSLVTGPDLEAPMVGLENQRV